ncbi:MAG TPA: lysylphosphatidylglycerol synthase transmembrane domain-containing protein [Solirubrobacteraceae bacterium]
MATQRRNGVQAEPPRVARDELTAPPEISRAGLRRRLLILLGVILAVVAVITLVPGLASLRSRFAHADPTWLVAGAALKVLSGACYVAVFRAVFCTGMRWRMSSEIGFSELGANALFPTGGAGGLALGAWALHRSGMSNERIARRSVAFFLLTSVPNVAGVIILGFGLAAGVFPGRASLALTLIPAAVATAAVLATIAAGRWAERAQQRAHHSRGPGSRLAGVLGAVGSGVRESLALLRHPSPVLLVGLIGYLGFDVAILWAMFHAFGAAPPVAIISLAYLIGELGGLVPLPGGIGGVDLGLVGTLVLYHVPATEATAAVLAYRALALLVPAVIGLGAFLQLRRSLARERIAISGCAPDGQVEVIGRGRVRLR